MELQYYGANCVRVTYKKTQIVIDDNLSELGGKSITKPGDIALFTLPGDYKPAEGTKLTINQPGEYEVSGVSITGIAAQAHVDEPGTHKATMYRIEADDVKLAVIGHIYPKLSDEQLEGLGLVDVLIIPVGGAGYTLDGVGAHEIVKATEPKIIIPTHYQQAGINYPVPQAKLDEALQGLGMEVAEKTEKLKIKPSDFMGEAAKLVVLG